MAVIPQSQQPLKATAIPNAQRLHGLVRPDFWRGIFALACWLCAGALHPICAAVLTFTTSAPSGGAASISNWTGATFDANNVGGSGVNANGGANNGSANDGTTYVSGNRPAQGQTFTTGSNTGGYTLGAITVRIQGYTNNTASGGNIGGYDLNDTTSTFRIRVGRLSGTTFIPLSQETATAGGTGNPGQGGTANGPGTYLTFTLKAPIVLAPNTAYAFDLGTTGDYFEMLGIRDSATGGNPYAGGTAYTSGANGVAAGSITTQAGERVFQVDLTAYTAPAAGTFVHPGLLSTAADFERMRTQVALGQEPWRSAFNALDASWMSANGSWGSHAQTTITRGATNDTSRLYNDIAVVYSSALYWKVTGDTAYADQAVTLLNSWASTLTTIAGDTNALLTELYAYQFAAAAEIMRTYPAWHPADIAKFQTMIYNVFYPMAHDFLIRHNGTANDHYWANWDLCALNSIYAIGVFCDNPALTTEALNYFYGGLGNGCIDRTVNFIHPGYLGQGQEIGRDQGHASLNVAELATLCQMAWNQGVDLFGYENNRVLSLAEYTAKYNLGQDVPFTPYAEEGWLMTGPSSQSRGATARPGWATLYHHYVNLKGLAVPYTKTIVDLNGTNWSWNGDSPGWDALTAALPPIATGANPSALTATVTAQQPVLSWWGSAYATSYNVKRATSSGGPYTTIATGLTTNTYTDTSVANDTTYYYVVTATTPTGETGNSNEASALVGTALLARLKFDETTGTSAADSTGNGWTGTLVNSPSWTTGNVGNAVNLAKSSSQYVSLPAGIVSNLSDFSISAWVYQNSASSNSRIFDFGTGDGMWGGVDPWGNQRWLSERYMFLSPQGGGGKLRFGITRSTSVGEQKVDGTGALPVGQWTHVIVTKSGAVATLYVNGQAVGQNLSMSMSPSQVPATPQNYLGKSQWRNDPYFDGKIDDFRIYRGALTTGQAYTLATGFTPATPPPAPANLTVTALVGNQSSLSWTASAGATSYTVLRATSIDGPYGVIATIIAGTTYADTGLTAGTTYYYKVDGANSGGDGAASPASNGVVALPPLPSVPTGFTAVSSSDTALALNWTAAANAYTYNVKRSLTNGGPYTTIAGGVTATTFIDTGLTAGTPYYYVVSAANTAGESANSAQAGATPSDLLAHLRFDETYGSSAPDVSGNGWNAALVNAPAWTAGHFGNALNLASASSQYAALGTGVVGTVNDFTISVWVKMAGLATWARIFDFGTGTTNYMFLAAQGPAGAGRPRFAIRTSSVSEQDLDSSIAIPTDAWTQITVTLSGGTGRMYINGTLAATNSAMTLTPASLGGTTLNYLGRSQFSADPYLNGSIDDLRINSHAFTATEVAAAYDPPPTAPAGLKANPSDSLIMLNWAVSETATTYNVKRATVSGGPYTTVGADLTTPAFVDAGLTNGTTYYYVVSAVNALGESANSSETAGTPYGIAWASQDIGTVAAAGSSGASGGTVTVNGSGADIWGTADAFHFRQVALTGNCAITARVWSVTNTNAWTKAGVMIRGSLAANAMNAALYVTPTTTNGVSWQSRTTNGGATTYANTTGITAPYWVRLVRTGTTVQGYRSAGGVIWTSAGSSTLALGSTAYVGLAVTSHVDGTLCTTTFDNVSVNWTADAPATVTATPGPLQVTLNWNNVPNAATYNVYSATTSGGPYSLLATGLSSPNYIHSGLTSGSTVYYVVSAVNVVGEGANSAEAVALLTPPAPAGLSVSVSGNQASLGWTAANGAASYAVQRSTTSGGSYTTIASAITSTTYTDTGLTPGATYYYAVTASNATSQSAGSAEVSGTLAPAAPAALSAIPGTRKAVLSWTPSYNATSYAISRATASGGPYTTIKAGLTSATYTDTGLTATTPYYYTITAVGNGGDSTASPELTFATAPVSVTGFASNPGRIVVTKDGTLSVDNSAADYAASAVRATGFSLYGGRVFGGANNGFNFSTTGSASGNTNDSFGPLTLGSGPFFGRITPNTSTNTRIIFDSLTRMHGTQLVFPAQNIGSAPLSSPAANTSNVVFAIPPTTAQLDGVQLVGGSVSPGVTNRAILPFAFINGLPATYDTTYGLHPLDPSTEMAALTSGMVAGQDAKLTGGTATLTTDTVINSLWGSSGVTTGTGTLTVTSGTIAARSSVTLGHAVIALGSAEGHIHIANAAKLTINSVITGTGGLTIGLENTSGSSAMLILGGANTFTGVTTISGNNNSLRVRLTHPLALQNSTLDYDQYGARLQFGNGPVNLGTAVFGGLQGAQNLSLTNYGAAGGAVVLTVGGNGASTTYGGTISGAGGLVKTGTGTLTLSGHNTFTGDTTVSAGTLNVTGSLTGGGLLTVSKGATLSGKGVVTGITKVAAGGTVSPRGGNPGSLSLASFMPEAGARLLVGIGSPSDLITVGGTYTPPTGGTVRINVKALPGFGVGTYSLITGAPGISAGHYAIGAAPAGYGYDLGIQADSLVLTVRPSTAIESWRMANFGGIAATGIASDTADPDGDGTANLQEYLAGTNPRDASSRPCITGLASSGQDLVLTISTVAGRHYRIEYSDTLVDGSWLVLADNLAGTGSPVSVTDANALLRSRRFYRLVISP